MMRIFAGIVSLCIALPVFALAQSVNCESPTMQPEFTECAYRDFKAADAELNAVYARAVQTARTMDADLVSGQLTAEEILRNAQRAWLPFRDRACEAESLVARGGTMQNQLVYECQARLTRARTEDLTYFGAFQ